MKEAMMEEIIECLRWYVENDDTNLGQEGNEFWEDGYNRAAEVLNKIDGKDTYMIFVREEEE